jgi:hypothetical protein
MDSLKACSITARSSPAPAGRGRISVAPARMARTARRISRSVVMITMGHWQSFDLSRSQSSNPLSASTSKSTTTQTGPNGGAAVMISSAVRWCRIRRLLAANANCKRTTRSSALQNTKTVPVMSAVVASTAAHSEASAGEATPGDVAGRLATTRSPGHESPRARTMRVGVFFATGFRMLPTWWIH